MEQQKTVGKPFQKGKSGNPGGRPKAEVTIREMAQSKGPDAFKRVVELMRSDDERVSLAAAQEIMNRAYGKPMQPTEVTQKRDAVDYSEAELYAIAAMGGAGTTTQEDSATDLDRVH